jgi:hypothetical protein
VTLDLYSRGRADELRDAADAMARSVGDEKT